MAAAATGSQPNGRKGPSWPTTPHSTKSQGAEAAKRPSTGSGTKSVYKGGGK